MFNFPGNNIFWRLISTDPGLGELAEAHHDPILVIISVFIAVLGGFTSLTIIDRMRVIDRFKNEWWVWLGVGGLSLGVGIWSMHFTGMIAYEIPIDVEFTLGMTLFSMIPAIIGAGIAIYYMSFSLKQVTERTIVIASLFLALGIGTMHYSGMEAMRMQAHLRYDATLFITSIIVAFVLALVAFFSKFQLISEKEGAAYQVNTATWLFRGISAIFIGFAVSGMHYTAMSATRVYPDSSVVTQAGIGFPEGTLGFTIGGFSTIFLTGVIIAVQISKNMAVRRIITNQAEAIALGNFDSDILKTNLGGRLGQAFDEMVNNLRLSANQADAISRGELGAEVLDRQVSGEFGESFQRMVQKFTKLISELKHTIDRVENITEKIRTTSTQLKTSSQELSQAANNAAQITEDGQEVIEDMADTMHQITTDSDMIEDAIGVIDDITFQTKILSLNAAVEAANAGEDGSGFAVVADEVRQLSDRTSDAAEEISKTIEKSVERTQTGADRAERSQEVLENIAEQIQRVDRRMNEISANHKTQSDNETNQSDALVSESKDSPVSSKPLTEEMSEQAEFLEEVVEKLSEAIDQFELKADQ